MAYILEPEIDQPTLDLITQLQLQDVALYFESCKGKSRDPTDEEIAFRMQNEEWGSISQLLNDRRMAMSFAAAVQADGHVLAEAQREEENATVDRNIARELAGNRSIAARKVHKSKPMALDDETLAKLQILYVSGLKDCHIVPGPDTSDTEVEQAESSAWASRRIGRSLRRDRQCVACRELFDFVNVVRVPCQHQYCRCCLADLFKSSMTDESLFPPRCCRQPIDLTTARIFLESDLVQRYEERKIEFETSNRTYCYSPNCGAFINPSYINGEVATCPDCAHTTCTVCKRQAHTGDCPDDTALQQLLATAERNGWQRCVSCWRIVELDHGCNHMTCRCGAQFCYICGQKWKTCQCEQWNEHRLLARANQIIDRQVHLAPLLQRIPLRVVEERVPEARDPHLQLQGVQPRDEDEESLPESRTVSEAHEPDLQIQEEQSRGSVEEPSTDVEAPALPVTLTPRDVLIARTIQELRDNHECVHSRWRFIPGPHRCEECFHRLPEYIFECRQCRIQACNRCRRNRL